MTTLDIVSKLWNLCNVLRDDGITYHQYVTELTYLLFLKMAEETGAEEGKHAPNIPPGLRWADLKRQTGTEQLTFYRQMLIRLGAEGSERVQEIYANAQTFLKRPTNLKTLVDHLDGLDWYSARTEGLGDLYEGLLQKNAEEKKSGAGQYFTPRCLIDSMVALMRPQPGEVVQDPAAGTGGFLIAADRYIKGQTNDLFTLPESMQYFQRVRAFQGLELVQDAQRLGLMNLILHGIEGPVHVGDALSPDGSALEKADLILTNPPFGTKKGGGLPSRDDLTFPTSNKQLCFLQHIYRGLKPGGRAAVVLPDNVLFEDGVGRDVRRDLMDKCDLHTILRLPTGIFYAQGVKTNVLFFTRGRSDRGNTATTWIHDMRTGQPPFGKTRPLTRSHFADFEAAYGPDPHGRSPRQDQGEGGRFRPFTRDQIAARGDNLDITWLREEGSSSEDLPPPETLAAEIIDQLRTALEEMEELAALLEPESVGAGV